MLYQPSEHPDSLSVENSIAFEHPLVERMRTFLRIELLHRQAEFHAGDGSEYSTRAAVTNLLEMLTITGRGDVRADVLKELDRHFERLSHYKDTPGIDAERLVGLLARIESIRGSLANAGKQFLTGLRESEFLNSIHHRSAIPGGTCVFDLPDYGYWLQMPEAQRSQELGAWLRQFQPLNEAISEVLWLTREASVPRPATAANGYYQHSLGRRETLQLVRVLVNANDGIFPRISAGPQRFTIHFVEWLGNEQRTQQSSRDVDFYVALC
jgi:cell division protein ZapD